MGQLTLYLVRHGQYDSAKNTDDLGTGLSEKGRQQSRLTGHALQHLSVQHIHYSTMRRTQQTAELLAEAFNGVQIHPTEKLWETIPSVPRSLIKFFLLSFPDLTDDRIIENRAHADHAFDHYFQASGEVKDEHVILVTHGNLIRYFVCRVLDIPIDGWVSMSSSNCGITRVAVDEAGHPTLLAYNEINHLPLDLRTDNYYRV